MILQYSSTGHILSATVPLLMLFCLPRTLSLIPWSWGSDPFRPNPPLWNFPPSVQTAVGSLPLDSFPSIPLSNSLCHSEILVQPDFQVGTRGRARYLTQKENLLGGVSISQRINRISGCRSGLGKWAASRWVLASKSITENVAKFLTLHPVPQGRDPTALEQIKSETHRLQILCACTRTCSLQMLLHRTGKYPNLQSCCKNK